MMPVQAHSTARRAPFSPPASHDRHLDVSRRELLAAIGAGAEITYIRGVGNLGDALIQAGTKELLSGRSYREIGFEEVAAASGDLALISGGGAWCCNYHEIMPRVLALAEMRFARVVVLPSSFEPADDVVRDALARSRAVVFARERESWRQIRELCDAHLAHDCSFFFDFSPYVQEGDGVLHAFRTDDESSRRFSLPADNVDISAVCHALPEWLSRIGRAAVVRTDRAHVMIAAALLGKQVEYRASAYHKVPAIAEFALAGFAVRAAPTEGAPSRSSPQPMAPGEPAACMAPAAPPPLRDEEPLRVLRRQLAAHAEAGLARLPPGLLAGGGSPRVTVVVLSWNEVARTQAVLGSLRRETRLPYRLLVIDNNSAPDAKPALRQTCLAHGAELVELDRNLWTSGGRQLGAQRATTEYVVFLDNDAEVFPGTLEHLVHVLDSDPGANACTGNVVLPTGLVQLCGGEYHDDGLILALQPVGRGLRFDDPDLGSSGPCRWVTGALLAVRRSVLEACPMDSEMAYFEDNDWSRRVDARWPGSLRRSVEALALHHQVEKSRRGFGLVGVGDALPYVVAAARFYRKHGRILDALFVFVPELTAGGRPDAASARLLMELVAARGADWTLLHWLNGGLAPLFRGQAEADMRRTLAASQSVLETSRADLAVHAERLRQANLELAAVHSSRSWRLVSSYWSVRRAFSSVLSRLRGGRR